MLDDRRYKIIKFVSAVVLLLTFSCAHATIIYGHRGARGLMPENTIPGYEYSLKQGIKYVDIDIAMTKDGVLVAQHDLTLNPDLTRDAKGRWIKRLPIIKEMTLHQLQRYDVGTIKPNTKYATLFSHQKSLDHIKIPTLKAVIDYIKKEAGESVHFQIEIKTDPANPAISVTPKKIVYALNNLLIEEHISSRTKVQAFDWQCLLLLQAINKEVSTAFLTSLEEEETMRNPNPRIAGLWTGGFLLKNYSSLPEMIKSLGGTWWDAQDTELNQKNIAQAHQLGLKVAAWSWSERTGKDIDLPLINKLIALHVDGIITDRPDLLVKGVELNGIQFKKQSHKHSHHHIF